MAFIMQNLSDISLDLLRVFGQVAKTGSMTLAARALFITQPAVSRSIALLESRLGCQLFSRRGRSIALTAEGEALFATTRDIESALARGQGRLAGLRNLEEGELSIAFPFLLLHYYLMPHLGRFAEAFPRVRVHLKCENRRGELVRLLAADRIDFFLDAVHGDGPAPAGTEALPLRPYRNFFAASRRRFGTIEGRRLALSELNRYPLIVLREGSDSRSFLSRTFAAAGLELNAAFDCDTSAIIEDLTQAGLGLGAMIKCDPSPGHLKNPDLFEVELKEPLERGRFVLFKREGEELSRAAQTFCDLMRSEAG